MIMKGETIKTLAEYIARLHRTDQSLEHPEEYARDELDTNGVEQDHVETFWPPNERWAHLHQTQLHLGAHGRVVPNLHRSMKTETYMVKPVIYAPVANTGCQTFALERINNVLSDFWLN